MARTPHGRARLQLQLGSRGLPFRAAREHVGSIEAGAWVLINHIQLDSETVSHLSKTPGLSGARLRLMNNAPMLAEPYDTDYGARDYTARDHERDQWRFGTYRPAP